MVPGLAVAAGGPAALRDPFADQSFAAEDFRGSRKSFVPVCIDLCREVPELKSECSSLPRKDRGDRGLVTGLAIMF